MHDGPIEMREYPQMISLDEKKLPAIKGWKVGGKYTVSIDVEMTSVRKNEMDGKAPLRADFKVLSVSSDEKDKKVGTSKRYLRKS